MSPRYITVCSNRILLVTDKPALPNDDDLLAQSEELGDSFFDSANQKYFVAGELYSRLRQFTVSVSAKRRLIVKKFFVPTN